MKAILVRMPDSLYEHLRERSFALHKPMSELIREAIEAVDFEPDPVILRPHLPEIEGPPPVYRPTPEQVDAARAQLGIDAFQAEYEGVG